MTILNKTPLANLTGSAVLSQANANGQDSSKSGISGTGFSQASATSAGTNEASTTVTTPADSAVIVCGSATLSSTASTTLNIRLLDGSTTLVSTSVAVPANAVRILSLMHVDLTPEAGSRTYNIQVWATTARNLHGASIRVTHIQLTDTHLAVAKKLNEVIKG